MLGQKILGPRPVTPKVGNDEPKQEEKTKVVLRLST